jgi:hypothetical protein
MVPFVPSDNMPKLVEFYLTPLLKAPQFDLRFPGVRSPLDPIPSGNCAMNYTKSYCNTTPI